MTRAIYTCTICDKKDEWTETWQQYGSLVIEEYDPSDLILTCSDECRKVALELMAEGSMKLPNVQSRGGIARMTRERIGY